MAIETDELARLRVALGTGGLKGAEGRYLIQQAYEYGYRLFDTAFAYGNEADVGEALRDSDDAIILTKLPGRAHGSRETALSIDRQRAALLRDTIDVYLIHWPLPRLDLYVESWEEIIRAQSTGALALIGVSNFTIPMMERLFALTGVRPQVLQFESHPWWPQQDLVEYCAIHSIVPMAWSPLRKFQGGMMVSEEIVSLARTLDRSPSDVVLSWHGRRGLIPVVKSRNEEHLVQNLRALRLSECARVELDRLNNVSFRARRGGDPVDHEEY